MLVSKAVWSLGDSITQKVLWGGISRAHMETFTTFQTKIYLGFVLPHFLKLIQIYSYPLFRPDSLPETFNCTSKTQLMSWEDITSWSYQYARHVPHMNLVNRQLTKSFFRQLKLLECLWEVMGLNPVSNFWFSLSQSSHAHHKLSEYYN